jgi:hypothetical protein
MGELSASSSQLMARRDKVSYGFEIANRDVS